MKSLKSWICTEKLDVERIELSLQQLDSEKEKLDRIAGITENLLKFQMIIHWINH